MASPRRDRDLNIPFSPDSSRPTPQLSSSHNTSTSSSASTRDRLTLSAFVPMGKDYYSQHGPSNTRPPLLLPDLNLSNGSSSSSQHSKILIKGKNKDHHRTPSNSCLPPLSRFFRTQKPTIELVPAKGYHPRGGSDYIGALIRHVNLSQTPHNPPVIQRYETPTLSIQGQNRNLQRLLVVDKTPKCQHEYVGEVSIGNPPQKFQLDFDTGSADFWVFSTLLPRSTKAGKHTIFNPALSSTWQWPKTSLLGPIKRKKELLWTINYGDGSSASGKVGYDHIRVGEALVRGQCVQLADSVTTNFVESTCDGVFGLALKTLHTIQKAGVMEIRTPVDGMIQQRVIEENVFTAKLGPGRTGFYTFGFLDDLTCAGRPIHWEPLSDDSGFWKFATPTAKVGNRTIQRKKGSVAIADTGTNLILTSQETVFALYDQIPGSMYDKSEPGWLFPANAEVPNIEFAFGHSGMTVKLSPEDLAFTGPMGGGMVYGAVQENDSRGEFDVFGTPWFRSVYAIFDVGNKRIGIVDLREPEQSEIAIEKMQKDGIDGIGELLEEKDKLVEEGSLDEGWDSMETELNEVSVVV